MPGGTQVAHHNMKHRSRSIGIWLTRLIFVYGFDPRIWLRSGDLGQRQAHRSQLQSSLLSRGVGTEACSRCYQFFFSDHEKGDLKIKLPWHAETEHVVGSTIEQPTGIREESSSLLLRFCSCCLLVTAPSVDQGVLHIYTENTKNRRLMLAAFKGIHTSVVVAALCFCCPLPLLPPASALCCCCPLPLLATTAAACHCSLPRARRRPCRSSPARASSPTRVPPPRPCAATTAPPGRPASLPSPFLLPPLALILVSLSLSPTHSFSVTYRRPTPNCKQPPPGGSPPPEPSSSPTSPASILVGSGSDGTPCASAASPSPSAEAASVRCLDHIRALAQGLQRPAALRGVHVQGQAEVGAGEQAVERVDGAMVEVMAPSCSTHLAPTSTGELRFLGMETHLQGAGDAGGGGEGRAPSAPPSSSTRKNNAPRIICKNESFC
ncbi:hypothetical protein ACQJBY_027801 [Aegilops geniculata]